ncbi:MAG: TRAP transporter large permease [Alphaproteobacteria bacterium]
MGVPIGFGMGLVGVVGFGMLIDWGPACALVGQIAIDNVMNYNFSVLPLFILMGALFAHSRMADELYHAGHAFLGHYRGGLAMATILACGGFSAVSGSSLACAAAMTKVSVPIMRRYGYAPGFAAGTVAAGSTLDILIPPSISMVIYATLTDVNLGKLMMAGFLPGLLTIACYIAAIAGVTAIWPRLGPAGARTGWRERLSALKEVWAMVLLFAVALGGIYLGVFTPTEAAGIGAFGAFVLAAARRRLAAAQVINMVLDTAMTTSMIFFVVIGALIFANLITVSGSAAALQQWVASLNLPQSALILVLLAIYIVLGCMLDAAAMTVLTVPIFFPIVVQAGIDPIWFGIFVIIVVGIGMIHPPMGLLLFVVRAFVPDVSVRSVFCGVLPFVGGDAVRIALLILFPSIVLVLPQMMK